VVGHQGTVLHTRNGGETWTKELVGTVRELWAVQFMDAQHGWVVGERYDPTLCRSLPWVARPARFVCAEKE